MCKYRGKKCRCIGDIMLKCLLFYICMEFFWNRTSNLSWKPHIEYISKKLKRSLGILRKIRYYVDINILTGLYYALIYPFLIYGIITWDNTYSTTLKPLYVLQKKALLLMTFSKFDEHSSPLFKTLNIIKLHDLV